MEAEPKLILGCALAFLSTGADSQELSSQWMAEATDLITRRLHRLAVDSRPAWTLTATCVMPRSNTEKTYGSRLQLRGIISLRTIRPSQSC